MVRNDFVAWPLVALVMLVSVGKAETIYTRRVALGLSQPLFATHAPGDKSRLFILEKISDEDNDVARIKILNLNTGAVNPTPFLEVSGVTFDSEQGLLGMAFAPDYQTSGKFYINYTGASGETRVVEHKVSANPDVASTAAADTRLILTFPQPQANHNGGWLGFSPNDEQLYIATGDGGNGNDSGTGHVPGGNAQSTTANLLGKMLRIDPSGDDFPGDDAKNYSIPAGNPYAGDGDPGLDEIWANGLRNPWRNSFDRQTGDLYIADVGQEAREEVNFQSANSPGKENYGWVVREGTLGAPLAGSTDPFFEYPHEAGTGPPETPPDIFGEAVTGGYVYRGPIGDLQGLYFLGDSQNSRLWSIIRNGATFSNFRNWEALRTALGGGTISSIVSFGEDARGHLYIVDIGGEVFKLESNEFTLVDVGTSVTHSVGGGLGVVGGTQVVFDNVTAIGEFGSQCLLCAVTPFAAPTPPLEPAPLDRALVASMTFEPANDESGLQVWQVTFDGQFTGQATLTFRYDDANLLVPENELNIYHRLGNGSWALSPLVSLDTDLNQITITADSFSLFALGGLQVVPEPASLAIFSAGLASLLSYRLLRKRRD